MDRFGPPSRFADKVVVRMPDGWRDRLKVIAARNRRSVNAELIFWIDKLLEADASHMNAVAKQQA